MSIRSIGTCGPGLAGKTASFRVAGPSSGQFVGNAGKRLSGSRMVTSNLAHVGVVSSRAWRSSPVIGWGCGVAGLWGPGNGLRRSISGGGSYGHGWPGDVDVIRSCVGCSGSGQIRRRRWNRTVRGCWGRSRCRWVGRPHVRRGGIDRRWVNGHGVGRSGIDRSWASGCISTVAAAVSRPSEAE